MKQSGSPNEDRPCHVQLVFLKDDAVLIVDIGIGEIDAEDAVVVGKVGPQEEGLKSVDQQLEMFIALDEETREMLGSAPAFDYRSALRRIRHPRAL